MAGSNSFSLTPKRWIEATNAIGVVSKTGRYGGTFSHRDIAFEFAAWISIEFKLYIIKEFQRLKEDENNRQQLDWNLQRTLAKVNYKGIILPHKFYADFVVMDKIILEVKAVKGIGDEFIALAINYLKVSNNRLALIAIFGELKLNYKRIVL